MNLIIFLIASITFLLTMKFLVFPRFTVDEESQFVKRLYFSLCQASYVFIRLAFVTYSVFVLLTILTLLVPQILSIRNVEILIDIALLFESIADAWAWWLSLIVVITTTITLFAIFLYSTSTISERKFGIVGNKLISRLFLGASAAKLLVGPRKILATIATTLFLVGLVGGASQPLSACSHIAVANIQIVNAIAQSNLPSTFRQDLITFKETDLSINEDSQRWARYIGKSISDITQYRSPRLEISRIFGAFRTSNIPIERSIRPSIEKQSKRYLFRNKTPSNGPKWNPTLHSFVRASGRTLATELVSVSNVSGGTRNLLKGSFGNGLFAKLVEEFVATTLESEASRAIDKNVSKLINKLDEGQIFLEAEAEKKRQLRLAEAEAKKDRERVARKRLKDLEKMIKRDKNMKMVKCYCGKVFIGILPEYKCIEGTPCG